MPKLANGAERDLQAIVEGPFDQLFNCFLYLFVYCDIAMEDIMCATLWTNQMGCI